MKNRLRTFIVLLTLASVILACNMPAIGGQPVGRISATPNQTMTALFESGILGSLTPEVQFPLVPSVTSNPTLTVVDPTAASTAVQIVPTNTGLPIIPTAPVTLTPRRAAATPLPTAVLARSGTQVKAFYLSTPPVLDGIWDEWTTPAYPATFIVYGAENWQDGDDLEGSFRLGWDQNYFYLAVKIKDDKYVQQAGGQDIYLGDSIELLLDKDLLGDFSSASLTSDDYQLGISPGSPDPDDPKQAYLWYPSGIAGSRPDVQIAAARANGVTRLEAAIPWSTFGIAPAVDQRYGFVLSISDNDTSGVQRQESMAASIRPRRLTDPTTWGEMLLTR